jgi:hypothetical protein
MRNPYVWTAAGSSAAAAAGKENFQPAVEPQQQHLPQGGRLAPQAAAALLTAARQIVAGCSGTASSSWHDIELHKV